MHKYLNIFSIRRLRGRLRLALVLVLVSISLFVAYLILKVQTIFDNQDRIKNEVRNLQYFSGILNAGAQEASVHIHQYLLSKHDHHRSTSLDIFNDQSVQAFDSLQALSDKLGPEHYRTKLLVEEVGVHYKLLKDFFQHKAQTLEQYKIAELLVREIAPNLSQLSEKTLQLIDTQRKTENIIHAELEKEFRMLRWTIISFLAGATIMAFIVIWFITRTSMNNLKRIQNILTEIQKGNLNIEIESTQDDFDEQIRAIISIQSSLLDLKRFAIDVSQQNFEGTYQMFEEGSDLTTELRSMIKNLHDLSHAEKMRNWENAGVTQFAQIIRMHATSPVHVLCEDLLRAMISYLNVIQGGVYILNTDNVLELKATYAFGRKKHIKKFIDSGEGLVGECFRDGITLILTDLPENYLEIRSGLGGATPSNLIIVPVMNQGKVYGVFEMASFEAFSVTQQNVMERVGQILASSIASVLSAENTQKLLDDARKTAKHLNQQEEKLRLKTIELLKLREQLEKEVEQLHLSLQEQSQIFSRSTCGSLIVNSMGVIENANETAALLLGYLPKELVGIPLNKIIPSLSGLNRHYKEDLKNTYFSIHEAFRKGKNKLYIQAIVSRLEIGGEGQDDYKFNVLISRKHPALSEQVQYIQN